LEDKPIKKLISLALAVALTLTLAIAPQSGAQAAGKDNGTLYFDNGELRLWIGDKTEKYEKQANKWSYDKATNTLVLKGLEWTTESDNTALGINGAISIGTCQRIQKHFHKQRQRPTATLSRGVNELFLIKQKNQATEVAFLPRLPATICKLILLASPSGLYSWPHARKAFAHRVRRA
jgi:hypothetical protein